MNTLGEKIRDLRKSMGFTQEELGKKLNLRKSTISQYENNKNTPDIEILKKMASIFSVSLDELLNYSSTNNYAIPPSESTFWGNLTPEVLKLLEKISSLSEESKKDLEEYIKLLKLRDDTESTRDESSLTLEEHA
ncbi:MAG: helix-turn-helix domain-containing protein [Caloramator sp.]|nr:helix-turn-helix domain-containing protein [Caloramator sp.]